MFKVYDIRGIVSDELTSRNSPKCTGMKLCPAEARPVGQDTGLTDTRALVERGEFPIALSRGVSSRQDVLEMLDWHLRGVMEIPHE